MKYVAQEQIDILWEQLIPEIQIVKFSVQRHLPNIVIVTSSPINLSGFIWSIYCTQETQVWAIKYLYI